MDSFELNKIAGAILGTLLVVVGLRVLATEIFEPHHPEKPGILIAVPDEPAAPGAGEGQQPAAEPLPARLAAADPGRGEASARKCAACHTFNEGGPAKVGPNLYGVVGRPKASQPGFAYSAAMKERGAAGAAWTYEDLDAFIENPKGAVPGTSMAFAGIRRPGERADVILYLRSLSSDPKPLPDTQTGALPQPVKAAGN